MKKRFGKTAVPAMLAASIAAGGISADAAALAALAKQAEPAAYSPIGAATPSTPSNATPSTPSNGTPSNGTPSDPSEPGNPDNPDKPQEPEQGTLDAILEALGEGNAEYSGGAIRLLKDVKDPETIVISDGKSYVVNLGGHSVTKDGTLFEVKDGTLTVKGSGSITGTSAAESVIAASGNNAGIIISGGTIRMEPSAPASLAYAMRIAKARAASGAAPVISASDGSRAYIIGGSVKSDSSCAAVYDGASLYISGGSVVSANGIAVDVRGGENKGGTTVSITGGRVSGGAAGVYHPHDGTLNISGGTVTGHTGVLARAGKVTVKDGAIITATGTDKSAIGGMEYAVPASAVAAAPPEGAAKDSLHVSIAGGKLSAMDGGKAVVLTLPGKPDETDRTADSDILGKFIVTGGTFTNAGERFLQYVSNSSAAASIGKKTAVGSALQDAADALGPKMGDTIIVKKAEGGSALKGVPGGVKVENRSGNAITVNGHEVSATGGYYATDYPDADYSELDEAIKAAKALKPRDYKDFTKVQDALSAAEAVDRSMDARGQGTIDDAAKALKDAMAALQKRVPASGGFSGGGGHSSGSSSAAGMVYASTPAAPQTLLPDYVVSGGSWTEVTEGRWIYSNGRTYANEWAALNNPYADPAKGQSPFDWFRFGADGIMLTGWYTDEAGGTFYLNPASDGTRGRMFTGWNWIDADGDGRQECYYFETESNGRKGSLYRSATTPDGYTVNEKGQWTMDGVVITK